ncbi:MAG: M50 family metallopeptidase [Anaerolineae bacterium]|nr:M50 family metallopeptidase [Anaerolineae bacterium]MDW8099117.1 M50 family metallopeptidase [Anaerolineae bacterium]
MWITAIAFFIVLSVLVLAHEFGHFIVARRQGIIVEEFGLGYPPRLVVLFRHKGVLYTLNAIPFGGFVRLRGEDGREGPGSFASKSKRARAAVLLAGPGMNFALAVLLFTASFMLGQPMPTSGAVITAVAPGSPAEVAGLQPGDIITAIAEEPVRVPSDITRVVAAQAGQPVALTIRRDGQILTIHVTPRVTPPPGEGPMGISIEQASEIRRLPLGQAFVYGLGSTVSFVLITLSLPILLLRGLIPAEAARPIGPVGIAQLTSGAVEASVAAGMAFPILQFVAVLSAALAVTNLLPLPALDGGRLLFIVVEIIRGRRIDPEKEGMVHLIGMALLFTLMLLITYQDLVKGVPSIDWGVSGR